MNFNLANPFYKNSIEHPEHLALSCAGTDLNYAQLARFARDIAGVLGAGGIGRGRRVGLLATRSIEACAGVLGTCWSGVAYVPLSLKLPEERLLTVLKLSEFDALIVDAKGMKLLTERVLATSPNLIMVPDAEAAAQISTAGRKVLALDALPRAHNHAEPTAMTADDTGYIEFTSGTTGVPKGVMVLAGAVHHYVHAMQERYSFVPEDRVAETTDLSFDLSVNNMFTAWNAGASLHVLSTIDLMAPNKFIVANAISVWLSVPSIIALMKRVKALRPGTLPSLRYSFFCGEPFPVSSALAWQEAASNSVVDNLYGPTEATVWCVGQRLTNPPLVTPRREVLAIGAPIAGMEAAVVDANMNFLPAGEQGELALAGPQLATGYFRAPELTAKRFPTIGGKRWYLTGDLAFKDEAGLFHHLGRIDNQVKVLGNRVELEDIEFHLRAVCQTELVAAVPWPVTHGSADGIVGFIVGRHMEASEIKAGLQSRLPAYMVPTAIHALDALPFNANGKLDRKALTAYLAGA